MDYAIYKLVVISSYKEFIIIRNVSNNKILKYSINDDDNDETDDHVNENATNPD